MTTSWPKPWLYSRVLFALIITFFCLVLTWDLFGNIKMIPGIIFIGALAVPFSLIVFFFETNVLRNIGIVDVVKVFFIGGVLSLLILHLISIQSEDVLWGNLLIGITEEIAKIIMVIIFVCRAKNKYILNGILIGAAVGAGFAVFETAGYAFTQLLGNSAFELMGYTVIDVGSLWTAGYDAMMSNLYTRAILSLGGHIVWTAMAGGAYMVAKGDKPFAFNQLGNPTFLKLLGTAVVLHALWDIVCSLIGDWYLYVLLGLLSIIAWVFVLIMIKRGVLETEKISAAAKAAEADNETTGFESV